MRFALIALLTAAMVVVPARAQPTLDVVLAQSPASQGDADKQPASETNTQIPAESEAAEEGADALPETPAIPVRKDLFPKLFEDLRASAAAQSAYRSCPADVWDEARPFWRRWWDLYIGDTDLSLETCGDDPMSCAFMCLDLRGGDACFTTARLIQDHAEGKDQTYAQTLFAYACALGYPAACTNRAAGVKNRSYEGDPFPEPKKPETAACLFRSFKIACDRDDAWGCTMHGMSFQNGEGVAADKTAARRAYDKSCEIDPSFPACETAQEQLKEMETAE